MGVTLNGPKNKIVTVTVTVQDPQTIGAMEIEIVSSNT